MFHYIASHHPRPRALAAAAEVRLQELEDVVQQLLGANLSLALSLSLYIYIYMYAYVYVCVCACVCIYMYTYTHICVYTYICQCVKHIIYKFIYLCLFIVYVIIVGVQLFVCCLCSVCWLCTRCCTFGTRRRCPAAPLRLYKYCCSYNMS